MSLNAFPQYPDCMFCCDKGITFDEFNGYRLCTCPAGVRLSRLEPEVIDKANAARQKLGAM